MSRLKEIEVRAKSATAGLWRWSDWGATFGEVESEEWDQRRALETHPGGDAPRVHTREDDRAIPLLLVDYFDDATADDARFIAHAREDVPFLLDLVNRLVEHAALRCSCTGGKHWNSCPLSELPD